MTLFSSIIRPLLMVLLAVTLLIGVSQAAASRLQRAQVSPAKAKEAKRLFKQRCAKCHGQDGAGHNYSIKHGRGQMPAAGEKLSDEQITSLLLHVRTLKK
jgi:mono/diheme cytochrome c family protein